MFILAAIGSAVGLGNIWRFPAVAYENGGGSFLLPYLIALLTAGIPFLFLEYALGHRNRGSAPLSFARLSRRTEFLGWWQVGICFLIAVYYAAIIAWALRYMIFSFGKSWGDNPEGFLFGEFLQVGDVEISTTPVWGVVIPLALVWIVVIAVLVLGVQRGVGMASVIGIPVLLVTFGLLVLRAVTLDGAGAGLDALFTPNWSALGEPGVWAAAYGQIFFSLSIGFGIMITYSSYVKRKTDMTGSGLVVGFSNSGFELLAGIGVFSALGFMAQAQGVAVSDVSSAGLGLAFVAFPALINEAPGGVLIGVLFFGSLVVAGFTSLISILEVVISAVRDKLEMSRVGASLVVGIPAAVLSLAFLATTSGIYLLDTVDHFINQYGILLVAVVSMLVVFWVLWTAIPNLAAHHNLTGSLPLGRLWFFLIGFVTPVALGYVLVDGFRADLEAAYEGYPTWLLGWFGWGAAGAVLVVGVLLSFVPWRSVTSLDVPVSDEEAEVTR